MFGIDLGLHGRVRFVAGLAVGCGFGLAWFSPGSAAAANVSSNFTQTHQTIDGFGTAMAWFRDNVGDPNRGQYNTQDFYDFYYDDLGASVMRMELQYTVLSDGQALNPSNAQMSNPIFMEADTYANIAKFNFDANGVGHIGRLAQQSLTQAQDEFKLHGAFWSPPHWMKGEEVNWSNGQFNGKFPVFTNIANSSGGSLIDTPANLEQFGRYTAAWVKGFEQRFGVPFHSLSVQNEATFREFYNSSVYTPELYVKAVKAVRDAFDAHNAMYPNDPILTELTGPDDVGIGTVSNGGMGERAMRFVHAVKDDPEADAAMDFWVMHGFAGGVGKDGGSSSYTTWPTFYDGRQPEDGLSSPYWEGAGRDRKLWVTETSGDQDAWLTPSESDRKGALGLGMKVFQALTAGDVSAYIYWQSQLEDNAGVPVDGNALTSGENPDAPKYAAFKHFAKYVRPGSVRFDIDDDDERVYGAAFNHDEDATLTYVLFNLNTAGESITLDLPDEVEVTGVEAVVSEDGSYHQDASVSLGSDSASFFMPGESIITLVFSYLSDLMSGDYDGSGQVEQGDLDLVLQNWGQFGTPAGWTNGSPDGQIDQGELDAVLQQWGGASAPDFALNPGVLPEPAAFGLLFISASGLRRRRA